ncbi:MAG: amino acid/amide transporter substrate-binding protein, family [Deltaproteobacteria bacterium]|nr:amino acid/amide transporter substrate-binding protein, family [Deltaproteobacteria bacterium]
MGRAGRHTMGRSTRYWMCVCLGVIVGIFFLAGSQAFAAEKAPIRVGILVPYTGIAPLQAKGVSDGVELALAEVGMKAGGRTIQVFKEDDEFNPTVGLTKVRRLIDERKVNFIVGPVSSAVALAIYDYILKNQVVWVIPCAFTRELTAPDKANEKMFRTVETTDQANYPMGKWIVSKTPARSIGLIGQDYKAGHDSLAAFKAGFQDAGGKVIKEVFTAVNTMDYAPFLTAVDVKGVEAIYPWYSGTDAVRFVQQYQEFGLKKRLPLYSQVTIVDDPYLSSIGDPAIGVIASTHYPVNADTPANQAFIKAYRAKYNEHPSRYSEYGYTAGKMIVAGVESLKGEIDNTSRLAKEIQKVSNGIETPSGPLAFDQYNQRIVNMYVVKTEKKDGKLVNVVIDQLGKVAQADVWKWWWKK